MCNLFSRCCLILALVYLVNSPPVSKPVTKGGGARTEDYCGISFSANPLYMKLISGSLDVSQDVFYVDPSVEGYQSLISRARKLGFTMRDILEEDVSTCVIRRQDLGTGQPPMAGAERQSHGRRKERIHRMVSSSFFA